MVRINLLTGYLCSGGRRIPLTRGQSAIVDDHDFATLHQYRWCAQWNQCTKSFYAQRCLPRVNKKQVMHGMHRAIMGLGYGDSNQVDHINHDTLDNRRENLRIVTHRGNSENKINQSEHGVGIQKHSSGRYRVLVQIEGRRIHVGMFDSAEEAAQSRADFLKTYRLENEHPLQLRNQGLRD